MSRILFILNFAAALALTANYAAVAQTTMLFKAGKGLALDDVSPQFVRLDTVFLRVEYTAHTTTDTAANSVGREKMLLEIGEHYTKFYSALYEEICYVLENYSNRQALSNASHGLDPSSWYSYVYEAYYVDLAKGEAVSTGRIGSLDFKYQEKVPAIEWSIEDSLKTIGEYTAQKATCRFRGRDYVAWFTTEIPLPYGPWKFQGLPGLILSVYDTENYFRFDVTDISSKTQGTIKYPDYDYIQTTRQKYLEMKAQIEADFSYYFGNYSTSDMSIIPRDGHRPKKLGNDFMELE